MFPYIVLRIVGNLPPYVIMISAFCMIVFTIIMSAITTELLKKYIPSIIGYKSKKA